MISTRHIAPRETNTSTETTERPYRPLLVIRPQDLRDRRLPEDTAIGLALRMESHDEAIGLGTHDAPGCREALHQLITGESPFLLLPDTPDDSMFETITHCMFSRQYIRIEDMPVLAWQTAPPSTLLHRLQAQGWPGIRQWNMRHAHWLTGQHQVAELAETLLGTPDQPYIFIEGHTPDETIDLEEALHRHCEDLLHDNPHVKVLLTEKYQLQKKLDTLKNEHRVLQERKHNAETTIGIIRNKYKDDYDTLFNWYQQEYEALPLWYKRFGQLIKVLTGKRTAKSLVLAIRRRLHRHFSPRTANSHQKKDRT
jgi:hypothetical protein